MAKRIYLLIAAMVVLMLASPTSNPTAWKLGQAGLEVVRLPFPSISINPVLQADLDGDSQPEKLRLLPSGQVSILSGEKLRWQSSHTWQVRQALIADLNQDGSLEVALLVWRPFRPWPVDEWLPKGGRINSFQNQAALSCHLILIGWLQNTFRERWAGSALADPILAFAGAELTGNGKTVLVTLDGSYDAPDNVPATQLKVWEWNGFGFTVLSKVTGSFGRLAITRAVGGQSLILTP